MPNYKKDSQNSKPKKPNSTRKRRTFDGNQFTTEKSTEFTSRSAKKLSIDTNFDVKVEDGINYCIIAFQFVFSQLASMLKCKMCDKDVQFFKPHISGFGFKIVVSCGCEVDREITSKKLIHCGYEINRHIMFVKRLIGVGTQGLRLFCALMEFSSDFSCTTYYRILENIKIATKSVSDICIKKAGIELKKKNKENNLPEDELTVSDDCIWTKRGYSSLVGVSTVIGKCTSKILDYFVSSKYCKVCETMKKK